MADSSVQTKKKKILYFKILLDILLTIVWAILMVYPLTGAFWHEWMGLFAIGLIIIHNLLNFRWIINMSKKIFVSKFTMNSFKYIISFLLLILMLFSGVSGILIAKEIAFPIYASDFSLWVYLHHLSSYALIILIAIHIGIHGKMLLSVCRNTFKIKRDSKTRSIVLKILALAIMVWGVKASLEYRIPVPADSNATKENNVKTTKSITSQTQKSEETGETGKTDPGEDETQPSDDSADKEAALEEFLSDLYCTACHRHCSLLAPQCMSGEIQAEDAILEFEAQYQSEAGEVGAVTQTLPLETFSAGNSSAEDRATLLEIAPIMGFWILGAHYAVRIVDYGKSCSSKKKKE
jgi:hypothetical protein